MIDSACGSWPTSSLVVAGECKPYQVKQVRDVLKKYNLRQEL
jgi:hypothetical protein